MYDCRDDQFHALEKELEVANATINTLSKRVAYLDRLINTHAPHGRNFTNEEYIRVSDKSRFLTQALADIMKVIPQEEKFNGGRLDLIREILAKFSFCSKYDSQYCHDGLCKTCEFGR